MGTPSHAMAASGEGRRRSPGKPPARRLLRGGGSARDRWAEPASLTTWDVWMARAMVGIGVGSASACLVSGAARTKVRSSTADYSEQGLEMPAGQAFHPVLNTMHVLFCSP